MKKCGKCFEIKSLNEFTRDKNRKDGRYPRCKACCREYKVTYDVSHKEEKGEWTVNYRLANKKETKARESATRFRNRKQRAKYNSTWRKDNPGKVNAYAAKRRAADLLATPKWLIKEQYRQIEAIYIEAARLTKETGIPHEVDHIVPIQGENVSGLHVPWNLQILTEKENRSKGNKINL